MSTGSNISSSSFPVDPQPISSSCFVDSEFRYNLFTVYFSVVVSLGCGPNLYALYLFTVHSAKKKLNELNILMMNLTISDLFFIAVLPMWAAYYHQHGNWIMPSFLCNLAGYFFYVSKYCSMVFLGAITYNQYQAITKPITAIQVSTRTRGFYIALVVWTFIPGPAVYYLVGGDPFQENVNDQIFLRCFERHNTEPNIMAIFAIRIIICVCFFAMTFMVLGCNCLIIKTLLSTAQPWNSASERVRATGFVCTSMTVFIICFVPHHAIDLPWTLVSLNMWETMSCQTKLLLNDIHQVTLCFFSASCILDPIIYCFLTKKFKKHFTEKIKSFKYRFMCSRKRTETSPEGTTTPERTKSASIKS